MGVMPREAGGFLLLGERVRQLKATLESGDSLRMRQLKATPELAKEGAKPRATAEEAAPGG